jgi:chromosome segregation ATPase
MSFMKQDINFNLLLLIGVIISATILLTLYFTHAMGNVNVDYNALENEYEDTYLNLTQTTNSLNFCEKEKVNMSSNLNETLSIEKKAREEYNQIYEETEGELTKTQEVLKSTSDDLTATLDELQSTALDLSQKKAALSAAENEIDKLENKVKIFENDIDDIQSCVDNADIDCVSNIVN